MERGGGRVALRSVGVGAGTAGCAAFVGVWRCAERSRGRGEVGGNAGEGVGGLG